jgi:UDP-2-acetamido-2-deoxy-ribo-hexuluronate aminotransferase
MMRFIDLKPQYEALKSEIDAAMQGVVESTMFIMGDEVSSLETELAAHVGAEHCVSCASGTDALVLALQAAGVGTGDEVITSPFSFFATAEAISTVGATPVFVDIEADTYNMDALQLQAKVSPRTRAILPVSIFGQPADMHAINDIAASAGAVVIEDAAQSFGAEYEGRKSCAVSTIGCTSFFPTKPLGCYGDGGALFTDDGELAARMRLLRNHGQNARYRHSDIGMNSRLDALQAAVLRVKLRHFDEHLAMRQDVAKRYSAALAGTPGLVLPTVKSGRTSAWAQYSVQAPDRERFIAALGEAEVPTAVHYPMPIYRQEAYAFLQVDPADYPVTETVCARIVSLPLYPFMSVSDQDRVASTVRETMGQLVR